MLFKDRISTLLLVKFRFRLQLACTFILGILLLTLITSFVTTKTSLKTIEAEMVAEGHEITQNLARQSTLALRYQSVEAAQDAAENYLHFPDIVGVSLLTTNYSPLLLAGVPYISAHSTTSTVIDTVTTNENELYWDFSIPVYSDSTADPAESPLASTVLVTPELIGYVHVIKSKVNLTAMSQDIGLTNLLTSGLLALILLLALLLLTNRVIRPIKSLSYLMQKAEEGDYDTRAQLKGPSDVIHMQKAFNTMMDELKARQEALERARDSALASAMLKGQFVASISHELRTPMNSILGMLEMVSSQGVQSKSQHYLKIAQTSGEHLLDLINDILDFSKLESAKMQLNIQPVNLTQLIQEVVDLLNVQAKTKHLLIGVCIDTDIPTWIQADPGRIRQILINLVGNSIKFTEYGCLSIHVTQLDSNKQNVRLIFEIMDTGIGIEEAELHAIFQSFTQADNSTTRLYGGTGLGLAISRKLVHLMGGEIGVESHVNHGSNFWLALILDHDLQQQESKQDVPSYAHDKILILHNGLTSPELYQALTQKGCDVVLVNTMSQAQEKLIKAASQQTYSLFIIYSTDPSFDDPNDSNELEMILLNEQLKTIIMSQLWQQVNAEQSNQFYLPLELSDKQLFAVITTLLTNSHLACPDTDEEIDYAPSLHLESSNGDILVVEDNRANQYVMIAMLEKLGYQPMIAANGQEALQLLPDPAITLILMDCHMPIMDGYETTRQIRNRESSSEHIPIIAMTADIGEVDKAYCSEVGMDDFLSKPLSLILLQTMLEKWSGNSLHYTEPLPNEDPSCVASANIIDRHAIDQLRQQTGKTFNYLVRAFLEDTENTLVSLQQAVEDNEIKKVQDLSHLLKGSSSTLGAHGLEAIAKELQMAAIEQSQATQLNHVHQLKQDFVAVSEILTNELNELRQTNYLDITKVSQQERMRAKHPYILIVDDDRSTRLSLRGCLEQDSYYIEEAQNGAVALSKCERHTPDMILMDAIMEEMNGFEAMGRILKIPSDFKPLILMLTASEEEEVVNMAFKYGATDFIPKPINLHVLRNRVAHLIRTTQAERRIHQLAYHDPLTCLPNRTQFMEKFSQSLDRVKSNNGMLALMFIDLDKFKLVNDTQGHDVGDMLLKAVSKRISHCVRTDDLVVRLGGDEFTILLEDIKMSSVAAKVANKICKLLAEPFTFMNQAVRAPVSVGISVYPSDGQDINTLMKHADTAMYRAKSHGGNQFQFYEYGMEAELVRRIELERDLRHAIDNDELVLHYQPQIDLKSGRLMGAEALVRWNHPQRGFMSPDEFIPLAEESGLILPLGEWVLNKSCEQMKRWKDEELGLDFIAVNLSGHQMKQDYLLDRIKNCLDTHHLNAKHIQLEMTESVMAVESEACLNLLNGLKEMGISVAIDDFGTGYSSLSYLTKFPVDTLKIDYSFVVNLPGDKDSAAVASGIIALAHKLSMQVIAEGVEMEIQREFLEQEQCDWIQGYLISRPLPEEEFKAWLKTYEPLTTIKP